MKERWRNEMMVSEAEIKRMNELYLQYGTYAAVAREVGRAPSTVKKYIDPDYDSPKILLPIDWDLYKNFVPIVKISNWEQEYIERFNDEGFLFRPTSVA